MICKNCGEDKPKEKFALKWNIYKGIKSETRRKTCTVCMNKLYTNKWIENNKERYKESCKRSLKKLNDNLADCIVRLNIKATKAFKDNNFNITEKCIEMKRESLQKQRDYKKYVKRYLI